MNGQEREIILTEEHDAQLSSPFPDATGETSWFHIRLSYPGRTLRNDHKTGRTIFKIREEKVLNWKNEEASLAELASASSIIAFIDQNLPENPKTSSN